MSLKKIREEKDITQEQLAYKSEVSVKTIQRMEKNIDSSNLKTLKKVSKALQVEIGLIIGD